MEKTRSELIRITEELNEVLGLDPPIITEELNDEELLDQLIESCHLVIENDELSVSTWDFVKEIWKTKKINNYE